LVRALGQFAEGALLPRSPRPLRPGRVSPARSDTASVDGDAVDEANVAFGGIAEWSGRIIESII
jgi:hypothetical protein